MKIFPKFIDNLFVKEEPPKPRPIRDDPFYTDRFKPKPTPAQRPLALDLYATDGRLYCSRSCVTRADATIVCTVNREEYVKMEKAVGPRCSCGEMFNSWK